MFKLQMVGLGMLATSLICCRVAQRNALRSIEVRGRLGLTIMPSQYML